MAALTSDQVEKVWHAFIAEQLADTSTSLLKADFRAAVTAVNTWIDNNAGSYGSNLTANAAAFAAATNAQQKAILMIYVLIIKYNLLGALIR